MSDNASPVIWLLHMTTLWFVCRSITMCLPTLTFFTQWFKTIRYDKHEIYLRNQDVLLWSFLTNEFWYWKHDYIIYKAPLFCISSGGDVRSFTSNQLPDCNLWSSEWESQSLMHTWKFLSASSGWNKKNNLLRNNLANSKYLSFCVLWIEHTSKQLGKLGNVRLMKC